MQRISRYIAIILLVISSLIVLPKELIHELCHHTDTVDLRLAANSEKTLSAEHQHCEILQLYYQPFSYFTADFTFHGIIQSLTLNCIYNPHFSVETVASLDIRGPPVLA